MTMLEGTWEPSYNSIVEANEELISEVDNLNSTIVNLTMALDEARDYIEELENKLKEVNDVEEQTNATITITLDPITERTNVQTENTNTADLLNGLVAIGKLILTDDNCNTFELDTDTLPAVFKELLKREDLY